MRISVKILLWFCLIIYGMVLLKYLVVDRLPYRHFSGRMYNLTPFDSIKMYLNGRNYFNSDILMKNLFGNLVMLMPLGIILPLLSKAFRITWLFFVFILFFNLLIELAQIVTRLGSFDVDDIILNSSGALIAYGFVRLIIMTARK